MKTSKVGDGLVVAQRVSSVGPAVGVEDSHDENEFDSGT